MRAIVVYKLSFILQTFKRIAARKRGLRVALREIQENDTQTVSERKEARSSLRVWWRRDLHLGGPTGERDKATRAQFAMKSR